MVSIQTLENDIAAKESDINVTKENIKKAEKGQKKQYAAMKKRIQYLYENGGDAAWFQMMLASDDLSDMLNKAENIQGMYDYDRESLEKYANTVKEIKNLKEKIPAGESRAGRDEAGAGSRTGKPAGGD